MSRADKRALETYPIDSYEGHDDMTDKEKLEKAVKLADAMYHAAQYLTTDASRLHKAIEDYHQFIITEYNRQEHASEDLERCVVEQMEADGDVDDFVRRGIDDIASKYAQLGAKWQREQIMKDAIEATALNSDYPTRLELNTKLNNINAMDEVKVIIIKERNN